MSLTNISSINTTISNNSIYGNKPLFKADSTHFINLLNTDDYVDFSIDYTNDETSTILGNIKDSFDNSNYMSNSASIVDCTAEYGKILKTININSKFDDKTKFQLTKY